MDLEEIGCLGTSTKVTGPVFSGVQLSNGSYQHYHKDQLRILVVCTNIHYVKRLCTTDGQHSAGN